MSNFTMFGVSRCGKKHAENQDCIVYRTLETGETGTIFLLGVADGISGSAYGGSVARWLIERHLSTLPLFEQPAQPVCDKLKKTLHDLAAAFRAEFAENETMLGSGAAFAVAAVHEGVAECFWAGDVAIYLTQGKKKFAGSQITEPDLNRFRELTNFFGKTPFCPQHASVPISEGDVLTIASDGANIDQYVLQEHYRKHGVGQSTLTAIAQLALRSPRADDVSLVAIAAK